MARATKIREETLVQAAQEGIQENDIYSLVDYPIGGITNAQMTAALTQAQDGFYQVNSVFMCLDSGTYAQNHFYKFNINSWVDVTPEFPGEIIQTTLSQLEGQTIDDDVIYSVSDYPIGGITQAQMNAAITPQQLGFYQVGSVYLCTDSGNDYIQNHFYKFSYDSLQDEYYWYDTHAGADIDSALSLVSTNPVENRVITSALNDKVSLTQNETISGQKIFETIPKYGQVVIPNQYQQLEYITSTGTQYIDLGIVPTANTKVEIKWKATNYSGTQAIIGCAWNNNAMVLNIQSSKWNLHSNGAVATTPSLSTPDEISYSASANSFVVNGVTYNNIADTLANTSSGFKLFGLSSSSHNAYGSLYYLRIYESNVLTHSYIPCVRLSDNTIGIYDLVAEQFKANNGTGVFTKGTVIGVDFALITDVNSKVSLTGDETIQGVKTFETRPKITVNLTDVNVATIDDVNTKVSMTGNETIQGTKTFEDRPLVGTTTPVGVALQTEIPEIEANNQETTTETLTKLKINGTNYAISGGGGGSTVTMRD